MTSISLSTFRYDADAGPGPSRWASVARLTCCASRSASEYTAIDSIPSSSSARMTRTAISPRLATRTLVNIRGAMLSARLVFVRHGQSTYNAQMRLQGQADPPLSETGRAEARLLAQSLPPFERVVTSDLVRASETAALLGYPGAERDPRWREIDIGEWEGRSLTDFP